MMRRVSKGHNVLEKKNVVSNQPIFSSFSHFRYSPSAERDPEPASSFFRPYWYEKLFWVWRNSPYCFHAYPTYTSYHEWSTPQNRLRLDPLSSNISKWQPDPEPSSPAALAFAIVVILLYRSHSRIYNTFTFQQSGYSEKFVYLFCFHHESKANFEVSFEF